MNGIAIENILAIFAAVFALVLYIIARRRESEFRIRIPFSQIIKKRTPPIEAEFTELSKNLLYLKYTLKERVKLLDKQEVVLNA